MQMSGLTYRMFFIFRFFKNKENVMCKVMETIRESKQVISEMNVLEEEFKALLQEYKTNREILISLEKEIEK
jgi:hypothetical protein